MASSGSESDVDFESADEGESSHTVSNETSHSAGTGNRKSKPESQESKVPVDKNISGSKDCASTDKDGGKSKPESCDTDTDKNSEPNSDSKRTEKDANDLKTDSAPRTSDQHNADKNVGNVDPQLETKCQKLPDGKETTVNTSGESSVVNTRKHEHDDVNSEKSTFQESNENPTIHEHSVTKKDETQSEKSDDLSKKVEQEVRRSGGDDLGAHKITADKLVFENKDKDAVKRTVSDSEATNSSRVLLFKERKALEKTTKASSLNERDVLDRLSEIGSKEEKKTSPGWGLGNWSASFISTAASSVSTFTSQVSQGIGTVLETVEASLGVPTPEELATSKKPQSDQSERKTSIGSNNTENSETLGKQDSNEKVSPVEQDTQKGPVGTIFGGVTAFTRAFESTSSKVITGSLDTLELIGKKTMDILTEGDPGLRKKRTLFSSGSSTLSQVLREARSNAEENAIHSEDQFVHYSKLFDDFQGLVHLEALEMLSDRCKANIQKRITETEDENTTVLLEKLKEICEDLPATDDTPDDEITQDFEKLLDEHCGTLPFKTKIEKIKSVQCSATAWLINCKEDQDAGEVKDPKEVYEKSISSLAELTAAVIEYFHKVAEMTLITSVSDADVEDCAKKLNGLTTVFCTEVGILSTHFCQCLSTAADDSEDPDAVNPLITNVYLECSNSNGYIQDAFQLLIPVLQDLALRHD